MTFLGVGSRGFVPRARPESTSLPGALDRRDIAGDDDNIPARPPHGRAWLSILRLTVTVVTLWSALSLRAADPTSLPGNPLLLDLARAGEALVTVGDHGLIYRSTDDGLTWAKVASGTEALLTAVSFPDAEHGWIVGHDGVILATQNGGQTWTRQDDGKDLDSVWLDVHFLSPTDGFAIGAYGRFSSTKDAGATWTATTRTGEEIHFNSLSADAEGRLYLAGESGTLLTSANQGRTWQPLAVPYDGSLFGTLPLTGGELIVYGLRGHIFRSDDQGKSWEPRSSDVTALIVAGARLKSGALVLAGQGGNFFLSRDSERYFRPWKPGGFDRGVSAFVEGRDGSLIVVGEGGVTRLPAP